MDDASPTFTMSLNAELYARDAVEQAIAAFAAHGEFELATGGGYHRVTVRTPAGQDPEALARELANYVIGLLVADGGAPGSPPGA